jgi:isopenicillin N synthase-like dioxygenase
VGSEDIIVPVIDIRSFLAGDDLVTAPQQVREAATTSGFFQIVGHGIDPDQVDASYRVAERLMSLPRSVKDQLRSPSGHPYRGLMTNFDQSGRICSEGFTVSRFDGAADAERGGVQPEYAGYFHDNVWPPIEEFRTTMTAWSGSVRALGAQMMRIFAVALELPIDYFDASTELDASTSTIRFYPARNGPLARDPDVIFDEHFDGGILTLLHQRGSYAGLQLRTLSEEWFSVPVRDDAFVVNIGALMNRWTNGRWPATRHRVIGADDPDGFRYTLPSFYTVAVDTVVAPLSPMLGDDGPRFEPVMVFDWQRRSIRKNYSERKYTTAATGTEAFVAALDGSDD